SAVVILPLYQTFPSPIRGRKRWDRGARSPDAPTEPCLGTTGIISLSICQHIRSTVVHCIPEQPCANACTLRISINLDNSLSMGSPTPTAWLLRMFSCNFLVSARLINVVQSGPNPVLIP